MKEFAVYTALRLVLLLAALALVIGIWGLFTDSVPLVWAVVIAFVVSGIASYFVLERSRAAFARKVEARAARASAAFEEMKSREDRDEPADDEGHGNHGGPGRAGEDRA